MSTPLETGMLVDTGPEPELELGVGTGLELGLGTIFVLVLGVVGTPASSTKVFSPSGPSVGPILPGRQ